MVDSSLSRFVEDEGGAVATLYALGLFALIAVAGVGYDYARMAGMHTELQNAADQAALAGATQLDEESGACSRAATAAANLLTNETLLGELEGGSLAVTVANETTCDATGLIRFWQDADKTTPATSDANADFIEVIVNGRTADYALTPIIGLFDSGALNAAATAGLSSAVCEVPPLMVCMPSSGLGSIVEGMGIRATSHTSGNSWGPGDFGFLEVGTGSIQDLAKAMAYDEVPYDCARITGNYPETGNAQMLYEAVNTRLDIYPQGNDAPLNTCRSGACPASNHNVKDVVNTHASPSNDNQCRLGSQGWQLPTNRFYPDAIDAADTVFTTKDSDGLIDAMGYSRDLCHYNSYNGGDCNGDGLASGADRFGDGDWPRADYFATYHGGLGSAGVPSAASGWSRYETYLWEQGQLLDSLGAVVTPAGTIPSGNGQRAGRVCSQGAPGPIDRRLLTVAVVTNCNTLSGGSTAVEIGEWYEMFLVEPVVDDSVERANGRGNDEVYLEVVEVAQVGSDGSGGGSQAVRRDVPFLVR
ncbi:TadE/TadG family type IV pilus assembly protein [Aurantiacibacter gilvus]|uniref:Pilus assembly protein TadG-related protein n=1 Tax=Aurantiacibacter gilvus TaxID=3139141 RepID=A0ABU9IH23_9SPHN